MNEPIVQPQSNVFNPVITIWRYCSGCWVQQDMTFKYEDDRAEYYECDHCHTINRVVVR